MKKLVIAIALAPVLLASCEKKEWEDTKSLAKQLAGEWNIVRMTFPANDSTIEANGQARFEACSNSCEGYFDIDDEVVNFTYSVTHFPDIPSQISMGPTDGNSDNVLGLQPGTYNILTLDDHNLTLDLGYCEFTDNNCTTVHRYIVMTR